MTTAVDAATTRAVVVGIDHYPNLDRRSWLTGAVNDALDAAGWLLEVGVPPAQVTLALGARPDRDPPEPPGSLEVVAVPDKGAIDELFLGLQQEQGHGRLLVFLFGHGYHVPRQGPIFITADYTPQRPTNVGVDKLTAHLASLPIPQQVVVMDSCQTHTTLPVLRDTVEAQSLAGLAEPPRDPTVAGLRCTSASMNQLAREDLGRGVFSRLLLEILRTVSNPGGPWEHVVKVDFETGRRTVELADLVHTGSSCGLPLCDAVLAATSGRQHPTAVPYTDLPIAPILAVDPVDVAEVRVSVRPETARDQVRQLVLRDMDDLGRPPFLARPPAGPLVAHLGAGAQVEAAAYLSHSSGLAPSSARVRLVPGLNPIELLVQADPVTGDADGADGAPDEAEDAAPADQPVPPGASLAPPMVTITGPTAEDDAFRMAVEDVVSITGRGTVARSPGSLRVQMPAGPARGWADKIRDVAWRTEPRIVVAVDGAMPGEEEPSPPPGADEPPAPAPPVSSLVLGFGDGGSPERLAGPLAAARGTVVVRPVDPDAMTWLLRADQVDGVRSLPVPPGPLTVELALPWGRWRQAVSRGGEQTLLRLPSEVGQPPLRVGAGRPADGRPLRAPDGSTLATADRRGLSGRPGTRDVSADTPRTGRTVHTATDGRRRWSWPGLASGLVVDLAGPVVQPASWAPEPLLDEVFHRHRVDVDPTAVRHAADRTASSEPATATLLRAVAAVLDGMAREVAEPPRTGAALVDHQLAALAGRAAADPQDVAGLVWAAARGVVPVLRWTLALLDRAADAAAASPAWPALAPWWTALQVVEERAAATSTWLVWADDDDLRGQLQALRTAQLRALDDLALSPRPGRDAIAAVLSRQA